MSQKLTELAPGIHLSEDQSTVIETSRTYVEPDSDVHGSTSGKKWAVWGTADDYNFRVYDKVMGDPTSARAMGFKIAAHYGAGPYLYKSRMEGTKEHIEPQNLQDYPEIDDFFYLNDIENLQQGLASDFEWWGMCHVEYIRNMARNKIIRVDWKKAKDIRPEIRNIKTGKVEAFYHSGSFPDPKDQVVRIPALDRTDPLARAAGIYRHWKVNVDRDYFPTPEWQSKMKWLEIARKIPAWILANINNGMNIKYHVEIPQSYFLSLVPRERYETDTAWHLAIQETEEEVKSRISDALAGSENVSKTFYTKFALDEDGKQMPGWKINVLDNKINDTAWLNAYSTAAAAIATADGVPPSLAGLVLGNSSSGSASDVREQFNFYVQLMTMIPRQTTLEWFEIVKRANNWDRALKLGYKTIILNTTDTNKSGFTNQLEPTPTTDKK